MTHAEALTLLFPAELEGVFADDIALEGAAIDAAQANADLLLREMFPDVTADLLGNWERVCGLTPEDDAVMQSRRESVLYKLRELGGLSKDYYTALAAHFGWVITIDEMLPFMAGCNGAGDRVYDPSVRWIWRVNVGGYGTYSFRAGSSAAGERLTWWNPNEDLETMMEDLKPAHTYVYFNYSSRSNTVLETQDAQIIRTQSEEALEI